MQTVTLSSNTSWYLYNFRSSTIRHLLARDFRVVCLSPEDEYSYKLIEDFGCEWLPLTMDNRGSNPVKDAGLVFQFWRHYRKLKPVAALHFTIKNNVYGTWAAYSVGVPAINNVSGLGTAFIRGGLVSRIVRALYRTSQPLAYRVFCQNEEDMEQLIRSRLVPKKRLRLLPGSGVDTERFHPRRLRGHNDRFRFLYAGRMLSDKGLNELVLATRVLNERGIACQLWLCGFADVDNVSSVSKGQLCSWGVDPDIEWLGPSDVMEDIYAHVDCVVLPSYREGMPRSLLEAGAMGLPVVATDVAGCRHIIEDGHNGLLCEARNAASLEQAMERIVSMPREQRSQMGENGRTLVSEKFSEKLVIDATVQAIESAVRLQAQG